MRQRIMLFTAKRMLVYLERRIAKCKQNIADDIEMRRRLQEVGADSWLPEWAKPDPDYWKKRIAHHRKLFNATRAFILRMGLGR